jgi:hypothetical protein
VFTAFGTCQTVTATCRYRERVGTPLLLLTDVFQIVAIYTDKKRISAARSLLQYTSQSILTGLIRAIESKNM